MTADFNAAALNAITHTHTHTRTHTHTHTHAHTHTDKQKVLHVIKEPLQTVRDTVKLNAECSDSS